MFRIWLGIVLFAPWVTLTGHAESVKEEARPKVETAADGTVWAIVPGLPKLRLMYQDSVSSVETVMTLASNTCVRVQQASCKATLEYHSYNFVWMSEDRQNFVYEQNYYENGVQIKDRIRQFGMTDFIYSSKDDYPLERRVIRLNCNRTDQFPWPNNGNKLVARYVDHDFEVSNSELSNDPNGRNEPSTNSFWQRLSEVPMRRLGKNQIAIDYTDQQIYPDSGIGFPFVAYRLVFDFEGQNLLEPQDKECSLTFNVDFSKVFGVVTSGFFSKSKEQIQAMDLRPFQGIKASPWLRNRIKENMVMGWDSDF